MQAEARAPRAVSFALEAYFAAGLLLVSLVTFLLATRHGIGILPDSVAYMRLGVARHFAPLYTWLLSGVSSFGLDVVVAAKWLGLLFVAINTVMIWRLLLLATASVRYAAIGSALVILHPVFVQMHAVAMTEPLFLSLFLISVFVFVQGLDDRRRFWFALAGGAVGFAMLARFAAAPILATLGVVRLIHADRPLGRRFLDCVLMGAATLLFFGGWMAASELADGESTGRAFEFRGDPDADFWLGSLEAASIMLLPAPVPSALRIPFLLLAVGATLWTAIVYGRQWVRRASSGSALRWEATPAVLGLFALSYAGFLLLSVYIQPHLPLNGRMQLPLYVSAAMMTVIVASGSKLHLTLPTALRVSLALLAAVLIAANVARTVALTASAFSNGIGYAHRTWSSSPVLHAVASLPADAVIYSNAPDVVTYRLRRHAEYVPSKINHLTGVDDPNRPFIKQLAEMRDRLSRDGAYVVFLDGVDWRYYLASEEKLVLDLGLVNVTNAADGRIYRGRPNAAFR